ncbi:MAG: tRNA pseudouridine(55) synthase TruB [Clostridia bacterium]|nr:tRNA pseudouridine(55) synthase TruB [Clostridia bacterium]
MLKPPGITSHDAVNYIRKLLKEKKVGHTGTLDPAACGVLPILVGKATRLAEYALQHTKSYRAEATLGITTDTQDATGKILSQKSVFDISLEDIKNVIKDFQGKIEQTPPDFSAVRYQGRKLYELARKGIKVSKKSRVVHIFKLEIFNFYPQGPHPRIILDITCSKGTYIRSLCSDIGDKLGTGAVLSFLIRTASGPFLLEDALTFEEIKENILNDKYEFILPMSYVVQHLPIIEVDLTAAKKIKNGVPVGVNLTEHKNVKNNLPVQIVHNGRLIAVGHIIVDNYKNLVKPKKVFV